MNSVSLTWQPMITLFEGENTPYGLNTVTGNIVYGSIPLASTHSLTVRQYRIVLSDIVNYAIPFTVVGLNFMGELQQETVTIPAEQVAGDTSSFVGYSQVFSITPTFVNLEQPYIVSSVISIYTPQGDSNSGGLGFTQPYIGDVFNKNALYTFIINMTTKDSNVTIQPQYTLNSFSSFNNITNPTLNTVPENIIWANLEAITSVTSNPAASNLQQFPMTALRFWVTTSNFNQPPVITFTAQIMQQGAFF